MSDSVKKFAGKKHPPVTFMAPRQYRTDEPVKWYWEVMLEKTELEWEREYLNPWDDV